jgi:hypothetical protein
MEMETYYVELDDRLMCIVRGYWPSNRFADGKGKQVLAHNEAEAVGHVAHDFGISRHVLKATPLDAVSS